MVAVFGTGEQQVGLVVVLLGSLQCLCCRLQDSLPDTDWPSLLTVQCLCKHSVYKPMRAVLGCIMGLGRIPKPLNGWSYCFRGNMGAISSSVQLFKEIGGKWEGNGS